MILEFLQLLTSDAPKWAKKQKLVKESIAIAARHRRNSMAWASHLENCKNEIREFRVRHSNAKAIAIFGSGHLLDIPNELLDDPKLSIFLFDAVHPRALRKKRFRARCHFINCDLNASSKNLFEMFSAQLKQCELFFSMNLLSQLALSGSQHLAYSPEKRNEFARSLIENHLLFLRSLPGTTLLISDFEKRFLNQQDEVILSESSLWNIEMPRPQKTWLWNLAPRGEISNDFRVELQVGVWEYKS